MSLCEHRHCAPVCSFIVHQVLVLLLEYICMRSAFREFVMDGDNKNLE
jgi:hypothetical protein